MAEPDSYAFDLESFVQRCHDFGVNVFSFRSEKDYDVVMWMNENLDDIRLVDLKNTYLYGRDCEVIISTELSMTAVKKSMEAIDDWSLMAESLREMTS